MSVRYLMIPACKDLILRPREQAVEECLSHSFLKHIDLEPSPTHYYIFHERHPRLCLAMSPNPIFYFFYTKKITREWK